MGTRNNAFVDTEKGFGRSDLFDVGLGLRMQQVEESCPNKNFMPMPHHQLSSFSCCGEGFDGGACGGGPIVCNTSNQVPCTGDIYDVVGAASASASAGAVVLKSLHLHPFSADPSFPHDSSGEMAADHVNARVLFTAAQWQELERQTMIYKYMTASMPVPPELLIPLTRNPSNVIKGSLELGFSSNSSDPEPWRCRRTDGKKWRCSRDVAPDQKYCERHSHKSRPRSRKPVELPNHPIHNNDHNPQTLNMASDSSKQPHQNPHFISKDDAHLFTSSFDQPRCLEWFMKGETTVPFASNSIQEWHQFKTRGTRYGGNVSEHQQHYKEHSLNLQAQNLNEQFSPSLASLGGSLNLNQTQSQETRSFIDAWSTAEREVAEMDGIVSKRHVSSNEKLPLSSLTLSMSDGNGNNHEEEDENSHQMGAFGITGIGMENVRASGPQMTDPISWMGSPPGGPLAEALCLGIASSQCTSPSSCGKST
ncbi:hypothetical protein DITRI_Ditri04bG0148500 [Diplodiscus trichospermus]